MRDAGDCAGRATADAQREEGGGTEARWDLGKSGRPRRKGNERPRRERARNGISSFGIHRVGAGDCMHCYVTLARTRSRLAPGI